MNNVQGADRSATVAAVQIHDDAPPSSTTPALVEPDAPRSGGLPGQQRRAWSPFGGQLLKAGAIAMIAATTLPFMAGCGLADSHDASPVTEVREAIQTAEPVTLRGEVQQGAVPGGGADGLWLVPLRNQDHFVIDGVPFDRIYLGVAGSEATAGLSPGGLGDVTGHVSAKLQDGAFVPVVDGIDNVVAGLPREVQGQVVRGVAPGAEGGAEATDLYLLIDTAVWLNGARHLLDENEEPVSIHLGAMSDLPGLRPGDHAVIEGRLDRGPEGLRLTSIESLNSEAYAGSQISPPTFDGTQFLAAGEGNTPLPAIDLSSRDGRRHVVVVDAEQGVAHLGSVGRAAGSEEFTTSFPVQAFLQNGPTFDVSRGRVVDDAGYKLSPRMTWVEHGESGDTHHGWYLHEASETLYQLSFAIDANGDSDPARVTHAITMGEHQ
ncbi:MAG: hypothetical protein RMA76_35455 [Deltaproteobacteria bacterium]|jgi:hypothetical protein